MKYLFTLIITFIIYSQAQAAIIHVNFLATGGNNGTSWANAYTDLQTAINAANTGDEIWVSQGTYKPTADKSGNTSPSDNRHKTFYINTDGIKLYGGFIGNEVVRSARDWENNSTILSGDIGTASVHTDNSYHVVHIDGTTGTIITSITSLDGFIIERGYSNNSSTIYPSGYGAGIYNDGRNIFPSTTNESNPSILNCTFRNNSAKNGGGAICNNADQGGTTGTIFSNCIFENNAATIGAAINDYKNTSGGTSNTTIDNCIFYANSSYLGGAYGTTNGTNDVNIENSIFINNGTSFGEGGALYIQTDGQFDIRHCTFYGNMAQFGSAISSRIHHTTNNINIENSILWGNGANQLYRVSGANASLDFIHTLYEGNYNWTATINHLFDEDPLFVDVNNPKGADNKWRTADDGFHLQYCSPALAEGLQTFPFITTDITGNSRGVADYDLGAYESAATPGTAPTCNANSPIVPITKGLYRSKYKSAPDANGWTHFCDCNGYLVGSFNFVGTGAVVPSTGVAVRISNQLADYHADGVGFVNNPDGAAFLTRRLEVYPTVQPTSNVGVRFYFADIEFTILNSIINTFTSLPPLPSINSMVFYKVSNPNTNVYPDVPDLTPSDVFLINNHPTTPSLGTWVYGSKGADHYAEYQVHSFSPTGGGGAGANGNPLPVELTKFEVSENNNGALLYWETGTETNNRGFHIQHSLDGENFEIIAWIEGMGTTTKTQNYHFTHNRLSIGSNYYRLVQEDFDGTVDYSEVRVIDYNGNSKIELFPNPSTTGLVNMIYESKESTNLPIYVFDIAGKLVLEQEVNLNEGINHLNLDFSSLNPGIYTTKFGDSVNTMTEKLIIK